MTREEFGTIAKTLKSVYTDPKFIPSADAGEVWYQLLKDLEYRKCMNAVTAYMQTNHFAPTPADIREQCAQHSEKRMDGMEAWGTYIIRAIRDSAYHSAERFQELPDVCKAAVGTPDTLREWAITEDENAMSNAQARFLRAYESASKRVYTERQVSPALLQIIKQTQKGIEMHTVEQLEAPKEPQRKMSADAEKKIADFLERHCV
jgi:hypothetical protein